MKTNKTQVHMEFNYHFNKNEEMWSTLVAEADLAEGQLLFEEQTLGKAKSIRHRARV
jgi:hypothetical protein